MAADPPAPASVLPGFVATETPVPAPEAPMAAADGARRTLADYAGRLVLVNFWATWCAPCIREMPSLDRLQAAVPRADLAVVALSEDRNGWPVMQPFLERLELRHLEVAHDSGGAIGRAVAIRGLPTTILYGRDGRELGRLIGTAEWDSPEAVALIRRHLGG